MYDGILNGKSYELFLMAKVTPSHDATRDSLTLTTSVDSLLPIPITRIVLLSASVGSILHSAQNVDHKGIYFPFGLE